MGTRLRRQRALGAVLRRAVTPAGGLVAGGAATAGLRNPALLLDAWDAAGTAPDLARGSVVLAVVGAVTPDGAVDVPLGMLGELALQCHIEAFGSRLEGVVSCPTCAGTLEVVLALDHLLADSVARTDSASRTEPAAGSDWRSVELTTGTAQVRAPTVRDLLAAATADDPARAILARCVRDRVGHAVDAAQVGAADLELLDGALEEAVGVGLTRLRTSCPDCETDVVAFLDPCTVLWGRVLTAAPALLRDVARLAASFGWAEDVVLALSPTRRAAYLEMVP